MVRERPARRLRPVGPKAAALRDRFDMRERIGLEQRGLVEGARYRGGRYARLAGDLDDGWSAWRLAAHSVPREELSR